MESYAIVYSSNTGNTALLAQRLMESLPDENRMYYGPPNEIAKEAELIFVGFWTDKGDCDSASAAFLERLHGKRVFLFGTAGFGGEASYFDTILARVRGKLDASNTIVGSYMCQGKMPSAVRKRYEAIGEQEPEKSRPMIENFDRALSHPDTDDLGRLEQVALAAVFEKGFS